MHLLQQLFSARSLWVSGTAARHAGIPCGPDSSSGRTDCAPHRGLHRLLPRFVVAAAVLLSLSACAQSVRPAPAPAPGPATPAQPVTSPPATAPSALPGSTTVLVPPSPPAAALAPAQISHIAAGFDLAAYRADPAGYCRVVDGSRYMQVAEPGPGVPVVTAIGAGALTMRPGERVRVQVQTDPGMPVSCSSQGLGEFPASGQSSITVPADAQGVATLEFLASPGTVGHCLLIVGSPVRAGHVQFLITIREH